MVFFTYCKGHTKTIFNTDYGIIIYFYNHISVSLNKAIDLIVIQLQNYVGQILLIFCVLIFPTVLTRCKSQLLHLIHQAFNIKFLLPSKHRSSLFSSFSLLVVQLYIQQVFEPFIEFHAFMPGYLFICQSPLIGLAALTGKIEQCFEVLGQLFETCGRNFFFFLLYVYVLFLNMDAFCLFN